jgi:hypothetical protein
VAIQQQSAAAGPGEKGVYSSYKQEFLNIIIFMVLLPVPTSKPLKNGWFTIERE